MDLLPTWKDGLTPYLKKRAEAELGETPEKLLEALLELRKLINDDPNFYCAEDDSFLVRFLRIKKFNPAKAFKTIKNYYDFKAKYPGILTEKLKAILEMNKYYVPPLRATDGGAVHISLIGQMDMDKYSIFDYFETGVLLSELMAEIDADQICGTHSIVDLKGISFKKMMLLASPSFVPVLVKGLEDCWPHRVIDIHVVNEPFFMNMIWNLIKPMVSEKIRNRFVFHGSRISELHKLFPREILPKQLGGVCNEDDFKKFRETVISKQMEIEKLKKYSFHRQLKPMKKSSCGLEDHTSSLIKNNTAVSNVAN